MSEDLSVTPPTDLRIGNGLVDPVRWLCNGLVSDLDGDARGVMLLRSYSKKLTTSFCFHASNLYKDKNLNLNTFPMTRSGLIAGTEVGAAFGGISISCPSSSSLIV